MTLNKKILATAIVGGLFATAAQAQVVISAATPVPVTFASELVVPATAAGLPLTNVGGALDIRTNLRYSFSAGEVRFARIECPSNIRFSAGSAVALVSGGVGTTFGAINGLGTNAITFSITAAAGTPSPTDATTVIGVTGNRSITAATGGACSYSLYDEPSQAAAGGTTGRITTVTGNYLAFARSYELVVSPVGAVSNVEASPSFTRFTNAAPTNSANLAALGVVDFNTRLVITGSPQPLLANGVAGTLADLLDATSSHVITGDFSAAANANGTFTGAALNRVYFSASPACVGVTVAASSITATTATFDIGATPVSGLTLCYAPLAPALIPASTYTQTFVAVSTDSTLYAPTNRGPLNHGQITRNGTQLQAPLAQVPAGWLSRIVLTNTGGIARPYTFTAQGETGTTIALGAAATGSIPANGTLVLNVADIATFTGAPRGTLNVSVAGPNGQIQGLYQIVNGTTGSISNHVMVRPGTN